LANPGLTHELQWRLPITLCCLLAECCAAIALAADAKNAAPSRLQSIESAFQAATFSIHPVPVVVRGIVISNRLRVVIEDRTGATEVKLQKPEHIALGDEVEVSGLFSLAPQPLIQQAEMRRLWGGSMPLPLSIAPDEAADGENELFLVQTVAELVDFTPAGLTGLRLNFRGGHQNFSAVLESESPQGELSSKSLQPGAKLRLTGILILNHEPNVGHGDAFSIQLRGPEDIEFVQAPSWWTAAHLMLLGGISIIPILMGIIGYYRVKHSRYRAVAEERANIARDIHDTLAQGYAGISLQLEAAQHAIGRDSGKAEALLNEALQLVRHSRDESHVSIDILRSLSRNDRLDVLIARSIRQLRRGSDAVIEQQVSGPLIALSYKIVNNLVRIVQEALVNAVKHAHAAKIVVRIVYHRKNILIEVEDNGTGFDPDKIPGPDEGHFGLIGMRERCAAINAFLDLESSPSGTLVRVRADI
jgi:signal transduction histidine kinase